MGLVGFSALSLTKQHVSLSVFFSVSFRGKSTSSLFRLLAELSTNQLQNSCLENPMDKGGIQSMGLQRVEQNCAPKHARL